jgi:hypothetical protein
VKREAEVRSRKRESESREQAWRKRQDLTPRTRCVQKRKRRKKWDRSPARRKRRIAENLGSTGNEIISKKAGV